MMVDAPGADGVFPGPDRRVGKYRLLDLVGRGAMGRVFAALDDHTGRKVAIKVLNADLEGEPDIRARFFREAQATARLGHRNVITIYDLGEDRGRPFIVMELLRGWTLPNYINEPAAADLERKVELMIQLCDGMAAAHAADIVHRDLKPGNLFVQLDGLLKVLDFGVARLASSSMTTAGAQPGTLHYMSPEQARGEEVDLRSDVFSAGGVFYFMLTGRKPFPGQEWARVIRMLESENPQTLDPAEAPPFLATIVMRCLAKQVDDRYDDFHSVAADLTRFQRQHQAETRRLLDGLSSTYRALHAQLTSVREGARTLGQGAPITLPVIERLHAEFPILRDRGFDAMKLIPITRARVVALQDELVRELPRVEQQQRTLDQLVSSLAAGEQALVEGRYAAAVRTFEQIVASSPDSRAAEARLSECRSILDAQKADAQRVKLLVREAQTRARSEEWDQVIVVCDQILDIDRTVPLAIALREAARSALEQQRQRAAELRLEHAVERLIRTARAAFNRGRCDEALDALRAFLVDEPAAARVSRELERLHAVAARRADQAATRAEEVQRRIEAARAMMRAEEFATAVIEARQAVECDPGDESAVMLLCEALERDSVARIAHEQQRTAAQRDSAGRFALEAARVSLRDGELLRAVRAAENAIRLSPLLTEAGEVLETARATLASDGSDDHFDDLTPMGPDEARSVRSPDRATG
jgi:tetratricopeptide (TPR) repeat protein